MENKEKEIQEMLQNIKDTYEARISRLEADIKNKNNYLAALQKEVSSQEIKLIKCKELVKQAILELDETGFINGAGSKARAKAKLEEIIYGK